MLLTSDLRAICSLADGTRTTDAIVDALGAYSGVGSTTATFSEPGEYILHAVVNDYSGSGGNGEVCCWTTALVAVTVTR